MQITYFIEGMELYYIKDGKVKKCIYNYTNKNEKKNVSFLSKNGNIVSTFLPKDTKFWDNKEEAEQYLKEKKEEEAKQKQLELERRQAWELEGRQAWEEENRKEWEKIKKKIEQFESINDLPLIKDFDEDEQDFIRESWEEDTKITIADGVEIELIYDSGIGCFNDREDWPFYYIEEIDTYICAECGLWQKDYEYIKNEVGYDDKYYRKLLPYDWNEKGIRAYLARGAEKQKKELEKIYNNNNKFDYSNCDDEESTIDLCEDCCYYDRNYHCCDKGEDTEEEVCRCEYYKYKYFY